MSVDAVDADIPGPERRGWHMSDTGKQGAAVGSGRRSVGSRSQHRSHGPRDPRAAYDKTFAIELGKQYPVENRTPNRVRIHDNDYGDVHPGTRLVPLVPSSARVTARGSCSSNRRANHTANPTGNMGRVIM
jgi:hypothetical protein